MQSLKPIVAAVLVVVMSAPFAAALQAGGWVSSWKELVAEGDAIAPAQEPPAKAEALYERALEAVRRDHAGAAAESLVLDRLGQAQAARGEVNEAEMSYLRSLRLRFAARGEEEAAAETLDHLASLYYQMERPDEGLAVHEQALRLRRQTFGDDSVQVARSLVLVAAAYELQGDDAKAEDGFRQAVEILRDKAETPEEHARLGEALINLGTLLEKTGRESEGEQAIREGLRLSGPSEPHR